MSHINPVSSHMDTLWTYDLVNGYVEVEDDYQKHYLTGHYLMQNYTVYTDCYKYFNVLQRDTYTRRNKNISVLSLIDTYEKESTVSYNQQGYDILVRIINMHLNIKSIIKF